MVVHKPNYYDKFICIAGECPFTCCQEWKIGVDEITRNKWTGMYAPDAAQNRNSNLMNKFMDQAVADSEGEGAIALCENGFCPFFNEKGLCDVVLTYGEENISKTCHTYPREEHEFGNITELTLAMGCPEALRLLWEKDEFGYIKEKESDEYNENADDLFAEELFVLRDFIMNKMTNEHSIESTMKMLFYIMLDCFEHEDASIDYFDEAFIEELYEKMSELVDSYEDTVNEHNELFLDIADNYRKKNIYSNILEPLAKLALSYEDEKTDVLAMDRKVFDELARTKIVYKDKTLYEILGILIKEEVYSTLLLPESDLYSMVMKMQWIAINYVVIVQALFLSWKCNNELMYGDVEKIVAMIIRMTGYSDEDIEEYLENSFQEIIWDWGYLALLMGENR